MRTIVLFDKQGGSVLAEVQVNAAGKCLNQTECPDAATWGQVWESGQLVGEGIVSIAEESTQSDTQKLIDQSIGEAIATMTSLFDQA